MLNNINLFDFQNKASEFLLNKSMDALSKEMIMLKAPTGAGKTMILIDYIDKYLATDKDTAFIWLCPGKGNLEEQSKEKMDKFCPSRNTCLLQDVLTGGFCAESTVFINWELITKTGNKAITDSERKNLFDRVDEARRNNIKFLVIVDEEHANYTNKAQAILDYIKPKHVIRVSATPNTGNNRENYEISEDHVIQSGLITKAIYVNPDFKSNQVLADENLFLLEMADIKRKEIAHEYEKNEKDIRPLVLIQFPNDNQTIIDSIVKKLKQMGYTYENGMVAIWMSNQKVNVENIADNNAKPIFLLMKQAIAMGWDCPRAKVLLKIRDNMGEVFTIQTIGRLRRMPEAIHYNNNILDYCYVYTTDSEWKTGLLRDCGDAYEVERLKLKSCCKNFTLTREVKPDTDEIDEIDVYKKMYKHFKDTYKTGKDLAKNKAILENAGYDFSDRIKTQIRSEKIKHSAQLADDSKGDHISVEIAVNTHRDGAKLMTAANNIGSVIGMNYYRMGVILAKLFRRNKSDKYDIQDLPPKEYLAFIVNNQDKLKDEVTRIKGKLAEQKDVFARVTEIPFVIPKEELLKKDFSNTKYNFFKTNAYEGYSNAMIAGKLRSKTERILELYMERNEDIVDWVYKNGDNGLTYFGITYSNGMGQIREFYPDYIVKKKREKNIWIIEAKGGVKSDGTSNNIDVNAQNKFNALKKYIEKNNAKQNIVLKWGFVREVNDELKFNNTEWQDDPRDSNWEVFDTVFKK